MRYRCWLRELLYCLMDCINEARVISQEGGKGFGVLWFRWFLVRWEWVIERAIWTWLVQVWSERHSWSIMSLDVLASVCLFHHEIRRKFASTIHYWRFDSISFVPFRWIKYFPSNLYVHAFNIISSYSYQKTFPSPTLSSPALKSTINPTKPHLFASTFIHLRLLYLYHSTNFRPQLNLKSSTLQET